MSIRILNGGTPTPFPGALNAPTNVTAGTPTSNSIPLTWTPSAQGDAIEYLAKDNSDDSTVASIAWPATGLTIIGLDPDTEYSHYVVTSDGVKVSPKSNAVTARTAVAGDWQLAEGHYETSKIPIEIINPQEGLTTGTSARNHYYRTYPNLEWRVPISVLGGAWPFHYEIIDADGLTGLTIGQDHGDADYGVLSCPNPSSGSYALHIRVTDQESSVTNAQWTLTVTTNNTLFVDAVDGNDTWDGLSPTFISGINGPMKTMRGWYEPGLNTRDLATYSGYHIYYMTGTYYTGWDWDALPEAQIFGEMFMRTAKPGVHLAYPSESPIFNVQGDGGATFTGGFFKYADGGGQPDAFCRGIAIQGLGGVSKKMFHNGTGTERFVLFECTGSNMVATPGAGTNPGYVHTSWTGSGSSEKQYYSIHNNTFSGMRGMFVWESYSTKNWVVEGNTVENDFSTTDTRMMYAKVDTHLGSVRNNTAITSTACKLYICDSSNHTMPAGASQYENIEICWNGAKISTADYHLRFGSTGTEDIGDHWVYRNTLTNGQIEFDNNTGSLTSTEVLFANNVRQTSEGTDGIDYEAGSTINYSGDDTDLFATSGLVDSVSNLLTGTNRTTYLGLKGHEVD